MARPLPLPDSHRNTNNANHGTRPSAAGNFHLHSTAVEETQPTIDAMDLLNDEGRTAVNRGSESGVGSGLGRGRMSRAAESSELQQLRAENTQLRTLCQELEQALQEAAQQLQPDLDEQIREYDAVLEEKNELIRQLHEQLQETNNALAEAKAAQAAQAPSSRPQSGHAPGEDELLALSEELERERRQLQEDEQTLMEQMREMEVSMARERAEMARQRNEMQRLQNEIRHELERLERDGGVQSKIDSLRSKLQDATARRGAAPLSTRPTDIPVAPSAAPRKEGLMGRLFGRGNE